ncbi:hypothetical protein [Streptomyces microflavus]|uniref:hypothetical protein n=1 Tax=Streptomyces microflavus TaxID=1919 RepID=UPI003453C9B8
MGCTAPFLGPPLSPGGPGDDTWAHLSERAPVVALHGLDAPALAGKLAEGLLVSPLTLPAFLAGVDTSPEDALVLWRADLHETDGQPDFDQ